METRSHSDLAMPLTFGGVAQLAWAARKQLLAYRFGVALLAAASLTTFFELAWVPVINRTIAALPGQGSIKNGELSLTPRSPVRSAGTGFLAITVDPEDNGTPGQGADVQVRFQRAEVRFRSLLGDLVIPYPDDWEIGFNRTELEPWWGAWHPAVTAGLAASVLLGLFVVWGLLAVVYAWPVRLISFYADRELSFVGAWRLGCAALLPGALFLIIAIVAYTFHQLGLLQLLAAAVLHIAIGWVYVIFSPFCLPRVDKGKGPRTGNPFKRKAAKSGNPFAGPSAP